MRFRLLERLQGKEITHVEHTGQALEEEKLWPGPLQRIVYHGIAAGAVLGICAGLLRLAAYIPEETLVEQLKVWLGMGDYWAVVILVSSFIAVLCIRGIRIVGRELVGLLDDLKAGFKQPIRTDEEEKKPGQDERPSPP